MSNLNVRRAVLVVISLISGALLTWIVVTIIPPPFGLGTTLEDYQWDYTLYTVVAIALGVGILLDKFMDTKILPK